MDKLIIGVGGVARAGKNTFAKLLSAELDSLGFSCETFAIADRLKRDTDDFCLSKFGISAFTTKTEEKSSIRDLLVGYGDSKRRLSQGKCFTQEAEKKINESRCDVAIVSDVRFDEFEEDEVFWIKEKMSGILIHVARFTFATVEENEKGELKGLNERSFVGPANGSEQVNDPKVRDAADFSFNWPTFDENYEQRCLSYVEKFVQWLIDRGQIKIK
jgi:hypothetical protein